MHQLSGTAVEISYLTNLILFTEVLQNFDIWFLFINRYKATVLGTTSTQKNRRKRKRKKRKEKKKKKLMFNKAVLVFKAYKSLAPPYLKQLCIRSNIRATSRFITLLKPRTDLFKTSFSFSGASLWNIIPNQIKSCNSLTSKRNFINRPSARLSVFQAKW